MRMDVGLFSNRDLDALLQQALSLLSSTPFRVQGTEEFFALLSDFGCEIRGERVFFPQAVVDKALARAAVEKARWTADTHSEWPPREIALYTHGQALYICETESNRLRPVTERDLAEWCCLVDAFGDVGRFHPTFIPQDVPKTSADFHAFATIMLNSREAHRVSVYSAEMPPFFLEACKIIGREPFFGAKCWVNSPFMITRENIEIAMEARRLAGIPLTFGHMPVAGAASPVTVAGSLVQNTAESLALSCIRLAVDDLSHPITPTQTVMDMKDAAPRQSGPDFMLHWLAGEEMHAHLYGGKPRMRILNVAASVVGPQSLYEKAMMWSFNLAAGYRDISIGCLACSDVGSPVQLVLDYEMAQTFRHLFREVAAGPEVVGLEVMREIIPSGGHFLESEHTLAHFQEECWTSRFMSHKSCLSYMQNPAEMIEQARARTKALQEKAVNQCPLSSQQQAAIRSLMKEADQVATAGAA